MKKAVLIFSAPNNCNECPCADDIVCYCVVAAEPLPSEEEVSRPDWCPLEIVDEGTINRHRMVTDRWKTEKENRL